MTKLPPKDEVLHALLREGSVFVHLDPRHEGVVVPRWLAGQPQLVLQIGLNLPIPIPDLHIDEQGWQGTLSFQRTPFTCEVPWNAVYALLGEDGRGMVWPDALPPELREELRREVGEDLAEGEAAEGAAERVHDGDVVSLEAARKRRTPAPAVRPLRPHVPRGDDEDGPDPPPRPGRRNRPPWLRVVK